jgi:hypothetical protein
MHHHRTKKTRIISLASTLLLGTAALFLANRAGAVAPIGDDAELFVTGVAQASFNDNIFLSHSNPTNDEIFDLIPGLSYEFGKNHALTVGKIAYYQDFQEFYSKSSLDNSMANFVSSLAYDDSKTKLNFDADFNQYDQAERGISNTNFLVNRNVFHADGTGEVQATENSSFGTGIVWDDTNYRHAGYINLRTVAIPVDYYFKFEPKLDLSAGIRFRDNTLGAGGVDSEDYYYNIGARGEFTPDLTGEIDVGFNQQKMNSGGNHSGFGMDSHFTYAVSAKSTVDFGMNDDFGYDATGAAYRNEAPFLGFTAAMDPQWSVNARVTYGHYFYLNFSQPRHDDFYTFQAGVSYIMSANVTVNGSYSYNQNISNITPYAFQNNILSISASLHF